jgi:hypothetical protein
VNRREIDLHNAWTAGMWSGKAEAFADVLYLLGEGFTGDDLAKELDKQIAKINDHRRRRQLAAVDKAVGGDR